MLLQTAFITISE